MQVINLVKKQVEQEKNSGQEMPPFEVNDAFQQSLSELIQDIYMPDHGVRRVVSEYSILLDTISQICPLYSCG